MLASVALLAGCGGAWADDSKKPEATPANAAVTTPAMGGTLKANPDPAKLDLGAFGPIAVTGVVSGLGLVQDSPFVGDRKERLDLSNGLMFVQKAEGEIQFFVGAGVYKIPSLGAIDRNTIDNVRLLFGPVPQAYLKYAPTESFSIQAGKLPSLIGLEAPFTFQNLNIQRGLLFNQTNVFNTGVQANYSEGPLSFSVSFNDGFYSDRFNFVTGAATYKADDENSFTFYAGANMGRTAKNTIATPLLQNNSSMFGLTYTYTSGAFTLSPYIQYTNVPRDFTLGIVQEASTYGAAVLAAYQFTPEISLAGRLEYIAQTGNRNTGVTNLLYGPGSEAFSFTVTPTYQKGVFFARGEYSYTEAINSTAGLAFGRFGTNTTQNRFLLETGIVF